MTRISSESPVKPSRPMQVRPGQDGKDRPGQNEEVRLRLTPVYDGE